MITSKSSFNTLFALMAFCILMFVVMGYTISVSTPNPQWYHYLIIATTGIIGLAVLIKTMFGHKQIKVHKNRIEVVYTFLPKKKLFYFKELANWQITKIKTPGGEFSELSIVFNAYKKVKLSKQENTNYEKILSFMKRNYGKKQSKAI